MLALQSVLMEILVLCLGFGLLLVKLISKKDAQLPYAWISAVAMAIIAIVGILTIDPNMKTAFNGMYYTDSFSLFFKELILVCAILVVLSSDSYVKKMGYQAAEYYILLAFTTLGMMVFSSAGDFITLYVGLEVMTMSFIVLIGFVKHNSIATEASFKYLVLSALSSAVMLYGMSLIYGHMGTTVFMSMVQYIAMFKNSALLVMGLLLFLVGFAYKLSAVPFHMWAPDIYQGAPTPVAGYLAVGSKVAALAALCRIMFNIFPDYANSWLPVILALAMLSIIFGNLVAIPQRDVKRMLAYSSVAQVGYLLLGVVAATTIGVVAVLFYVTAYAFANIGAFIAAADIEVQTGTTDMDKYAGMSHRSPLLAAGLFVFMVSLGGLPPSGGFIGKFLLFTAAIKSGYMLFAIIALIFSMISVYYYFGLVRKLYFAEEIEGSDQSALKSPIGVKIGIAVCIIVSVAMGIFFNPMVESATTALSTMILF